MTMDDLPPPPVPAGADLRGMLFMPLDVQRLLDSDLFITCTGDEFKAAVALWCKSWSQVPAASLPDDDRILADYSRAGSRWKKVKAAAMRGWFKASDGRLYHPVVAEKAREAWESRLAQRARTEAARAARAASDKARRSNVTTSLTDAVTDNATASKGQGQGQGQGQGLEDAAASSARASAAAADPVFGEEQASPPDIPVVRDRNLGDLQALHPKIYIGRDERCAWQAVLDEYGWEIVDEACRRIGPAIPQGRRILLSILTGWIAENVKPMETT